MEKMQLLEKYPDVLTIKDLMEIFSIKKAKAYQIVKESKIPSFRLDGDLIRLLKRDVIEYIEKQYIPVLKNTDNENIFTLETVSHLNLAEEKAILNSSDCGRMVQGG